MAPLVSDTDANVVAFKVELALSCSASQMCFVRGLDLIATHLDTIVGYSLFNKE